MGRLPAENNYAIQSDVSRGSKVRLFAPHGGCIEPCTGPIVLAIAAENVDYFVFNGVRKKDCFKTLHVTSTHYDEPQCLRMTEESEVGIAIHGCDGEKSFIEVGGGDRDLASQLAEYLKARGFTVISASQARKGEDGRNFINRAKRGGVQLELSAGFRKSLFPDFPRATRRNPQTFPAFIEAMRVWISSIEQSIG